MKKQLLLLLLAATLFGFDFSSTPKIAIQNTILARVNGNTISMMDVKKKMDVAFLQSYPQLIDNDQARLQFYEASWRHILMDMIDNELIIADAQDKEMKLSDGEIREALEERFGPNVTLTLDKLDLTHDEAWKMIKNELIVQRMSWWFIHSKAVSSVTPQDIRGAYRLYLEKNPAYSNWTYRVVSIRLGEQNEELVQKVHTLLVEKNTSPETLEAALKKLEVPGSTIAVSNEFIATTQELSDLHRTSLETLGAGEYSKPSYQLSKADKKVVYRIFYLVTKNDVPAPKFEDLSLTLRNQLIQTAVGKTSQTYLGKLRKHYGFEAADAIPEDLHPFSLQ
jgi:hypothetical protein